METSDLPADADTTNATNATIAIKFPTESKSVKRRSSERSLSHRAAHYRPPTAFVYILLQPFRYRHAGFDGRNKKMSRQTRFPYCMTLRLTAPMESELANLAYDLRLSRAGFIRIALRRAIADAYERGTQHTQLQTQGGAL